MLLFSSPVKDGIMKYMKFILSITITLSLLYALNTRLLIDGNPIPPLGKFLDPYSGFWQNAESVNENTEEVTVNLEGVTNKVDIVFDNNQIPHIFAKNNNDLYMAQGYIIAKMRLWQMEFQTHAAAGRVSELIGEKGINFDRTQRRKGMVFGAKKTLETMKNEPELFKLIEAYALGANNYIGSLNYKDLPLEYKLLDYTPEEWTPLKTALIQEYMIDNLTGWDCDLENTNALQLFGEDNFNLLFPDWIPGIEAVVPTTAPWEFTPIPIDVNTTSTPTSLTKNIIDRPDPDNGSNNWVVAGSKTKSRKPILANDMHLGLNLPSLWIVMQLHSPDVNVMGYTFTGAPGIVEGLNDSIAWGFTNSPRDTKDWYDITFKDASRNEYLYDSIWRKTKKIVEKIKVRGDSIYLDTVIYTHHGPVVYDDSFLSSNNSTNNYALRWIGHDPSQLINAIYLLNRSKNYDDYKSALNYWEAPSQNIAFASTSGDIAITVQGKFPVKWKGQGKFLLDGATPSHEWQGFIPMEQNAFQYNPERGFVSSANQHAVDPQYPYYFYNGNNEYYRNRRINRLLDSLTSITPEDFMNMHQDVYSIKAEEVLPLFLDSLLDENLNDTEKAFVSKLKGWNYNFEATSDTPILFELWWENFKALLWDEFDRDDMALIYPNDFNTTFIIKNHPEIEFIDNKNTLEKETLSQLINTSFNLAVEGLSEWDQKNDLPTTWANYKKTNITHLARIPALSRNNVQTGGHANTINAMKSNWGPSQRLIVEMTSPPKAWTIYAGGQSGNPGSPYYDNFIDKWRDGEYIELPFMQSPESHLDQVKNKITLQSK